MEGLDLAAINKQLGLSDDEILMSDKAIISDKELETMQGIVAAGNTPPLNFKKEDDLSGDDAPDYIKPYKDLLASPFEKPEDPNTDYSERSIKEFGQNFGHLRSRDQFSDELLSRKTYNEFIAQQPSFKQVEDILEGRVDQGQLVRNKIKEIMERNLTYTDELYDQKVAEVFEEPGKLNEKGKAIFDQAVAPYKNWMEQTKNEARLQAEKAVSDSRIFNSTISSRVNDYSLFGLTLPPEMAESLVEYVKAGKNDEWLDNPNLNAQEKADREILIAIFSNDKFRAAFFNMISERGEMFGVNKKAKKLL